jgi:hypothetical protein
MTKYTYKVLITIAIVALLLSFYCSLYWLWFHMYDVLILNDVIPWVNHKALTYMFRSTNQFMPIGLFCFLAVYILLLISKKKADKILLWLLFGYIITSVILLYGLICFNSGWQGLTTMPKEVWWL